jgi:hypothetical protein
MFETLSFNVRLRQIKKRTFLLEPDIEGSFSSIYFVPRDLFFDRINAIDDAITPWLISNTQKKYWLTRIILPTELGSVPKQLQLSFISSFDASFFKLSTM